MKKRSRPYLSDIRSQAAGATRARVLQASKALFGTRGIDRVTIEQIAKKAKVSVSTIFTLYKSKEGILRELMKSALFGQHFQIRAQPLGNGAQQDDGGCSYKEENTEHHGCDI